ncbi:50S ribosomal protein L31 [Aeromonas media]|uniref:50S ribosomal protein L31 n=1 Tax=Aeromonas media TaxID=651 RepID=UPI00384A9705
MSLHIHPEYSKGLPHDLTSRTQKWEVGNSCSYVMLDVSSASHPFYTGNQKQAGKQGQVARFGQRFGQFFNKGKEKS